MSTEYESITSHELRDYARHAFEIDVDGSRFGMFSISPDGCSLAWKGNVAFTDLETAFHEFVFGATRGQLEIEKQFDVEAQIVATFQMDEDPSSFIQFVIGDHEQRSKYRQALEKAHDHSLFARFDLEIPSNCQTNWEQSAGPFSFTADNPRFLAERSASELAVRLPRGMEWSPELMKWVISHHSIYQSHEGSIDPIDLAATLSRHARF